MILPLLLLPPRGLNRLWVMNFQLQHHTALLQELLRSSARTCLCTGIHPLVLLFLLDESARTQMSVHADAHAPPNAHTYMLANNMCTFSQLCNRTSPTRREGAPRHLCTRRNDITNVTCYPSRGGLLGVPTVDFDER
jgi:hypothetical protein